MFAQLILFFVGEFLRYASVRHASIIHPKLSNPHTLKIFTNTSTSFHSVLLCSYHTVNKCSLTSTTGYSKTDDDVKSKAPDDNPLQPPANIMLFKPKLTISIELMSLPSMTNIRTVLLSTVYQTERRDTSGID